MEGERRLRAEEEEFGQDAAISQRHRIDPSWSSPFWPDLPITPKARAFEREQPIELSSFSRTAVELRIGRLLITFKLSSLVASRGDPESGAW